MHQALAAAAKDVALRGGNDRDRRIPQPHHTLLEQIDGHIELLEFLLVGQLGDHHQVSAHAEVVGVVPEHHTTPAVFLQLTDGFLVAAQYPLADAVVRASELQTGHPVPDVVQGHLAVLVDRGLIPQIVQNDELLGTGLHPVGLRRDIIVLQLTALALVEASVTGRLHLLYPLWYGISLRFRGLDASL